MQDAAHIYSKLLELKYPWMVDSVSIDSADEIDVYEEIFREISGDGKY